MNDTVVLRTAASPAVSSLVLRPWAMADVAALVEVCRDPAMRRWTSSAVANEADATRWIQDQERGWAAGTRFGFAVLDTEPDADHGRLVGNMALKNAGVGGPSAEVGYWTAAHARGQGVAPRALEILTGWAFDTFGAGGLKRLELLHRVDNLASCRVAQKSRYDFDRVLPAAPPAFPLDGHLHTRRQDA